MTLRTASEERGAAVAKPAFLRRDWWYLGGLVAVTFAYFWQAAIGRGVFFHEDLHRFFYPVKAFYAEALQAHRLAMWNPYIGAGYPQYAEGQVAAFYPLNPLLFGLLPLPLAFNHMIIWHFALAGIFCYLFLRKRGLSGPAAVLGAAVFEWSGFMVSHLQHPSITCSVAWLPLLLYFLEDGRQRAGAGRSLWQPALAGGGVVGLQALAAHPPTLLYSLLMGALYLLGAGIGVRRAAALGGGMLVIGLSVSAVQWLPTAQMLHRAAPAAMTSFAYYYEFMTQYGLVPRQLATLVFPHYVGSPAYGTYVGVEYFWEVCGYVGVLTLPLMIWGAVCRPRAVWPFVIMGVVGLALAVGPGNPIYRALSHVPVVNSFRAPGRHLLLWTVAGAALAAEGMEALLAARSTRSRATIPAEAAMLVLASAGVAIALWSARVWPADGTRPAVLPGEWMFLGVNGALFGVLLLASRVGGSRRLLWSGAGAVILADLLAFATPLTPVAPVSSLYGATPWTAQQIAKDASWCRVWAWRTVTPASPFLRQPWPWAHGLAPYQWDQERLRPDLPICWRLRAVSAYVTSPRELETTVELIENRHDSLADPGFEHLRPIADLLGVKYFVLGLPQPGLAFLEARHQLALYRNPQALPRAWVTGSAEAAVDRRRELVDAIAPSFPRRERALLNAPPPVRLTRPREIPAEIAFEDPRPEVMRMRTHTDLPGMLVVSELYDPDWRATLDGSAVRLYRADGLVRAVFLPAGRHTVTFRYENSAYRTGLRISMVTAALWVGLVGLIAARERGRHGTARYQGQEREA
jgi:hypothetical protein